MTKKIPLPVLLESTLLGQHAEADGRIKDEYQIGARLVWVSHRSDESREDAAREATALFASAWTDMPRAIEAAEEASRALLHDVWLQHDQTTRNGRRLNVWGLTVSSADGITIYEVGENPEFDFHTPTFHVLDVFEERPMMLPVFPQGHRIGVERLPNGQMRVIAAR